MAGEKSLGFATTPGMDAMRARTFMMGSIL